jgi:subtilase family serine protease
MPKLPRPLRLGGAALLGLATIALTGSLTSANAATAASPPAASSLSTLRNSLPATTDPQTGSYSAPSMTVEVALAPQNQAGLNSALQAIYTEGSSQYHQFLSAGQFDAQYAPSAAERASVASYLAGESLTVASTNSPFLLSVTGSSAKITAAFHTSLSNYVDPRGIRYFQNSRTLQVPTSIVSDIQGVVGLTNTVREHPESSSRSRGRRRPAPPPRRPAARPVT